MEEFRSMYRPTLPAKLAQGTRATNLEIQELLFVRQRGHEMFM